MTDSHPGRFLQTDPIPGGRPNAYDYADQDPINNYDLAGTRRMDLDATRSPYYKSPKRGVFSRVAHGVVHVAGAVGGDLLLPHGWLARSESDARNGALAGFGTGFAGGCVAAVWAAGVGCFVVGIPAGIQDAELGAASGFL